jgi:hypothetical protein
MELLTKKKNLTMKRLLYNPHGSDGTQEVKAGGKEKLKTL